MYLGAIGPGERTQVDQHLAACPRCREELAGLEVRVTGIPAGTRCQLRVTNTRDQDIAAGGWTITAGSQHTWYPASVPWPTASLRGFDITADGQTLVTVPA